MFAHVDVVGVGIVALVGDVFDGAEALFIDAGEAVAQRLGRVPYSAKPRPVSIFQRSVASRICCMTRSANSSPFGSVCETPVISLVTSYRPM